MARKHDRRPPTLADAPAWMIEELRRRTDLPPQECQRLLNRATVTEYRRVMAARSPIDFQRISRDSYVASGLQLDPIEDDPAFSAVLLRASLEAQRVVGTGGDMGYCFAFWDCKKRILWKRYGVQWRDEAELNPGWEFD